MAQHDPIVLAKQIATLDHLSGGRFVLGMGYGWNAQEAADHGVAFADRRAVAREKVLCMEALWESRRGRLRGPFRPPAPVVLLAQAGPAAPGHGSSSAADRGPSSSPPWPSTPTAGCPSAGPGWPRPCPSSAGPSRPPVATRPRAEVVPFGTIPSEGKLDHYASLGVTEVVVRIPSGPDDEMRRALDDYTRFLPSA